MLAVVSDSSPLVYLARLQRFELLRKLFEKVIIPKAVWQEVATQGQKNPEGAEVKNAVKAGWLVLESFQGQTVIREPDLISLGEGEREAILLAREKKALLIIDELEGRRVAARLGVHCTGTLGILIESKLRGLIPAVRSELERLKAETNFRFTDDLLEAVLKQVGEAT